MPDTIFSQGTRVLDLVVVVVVVVGYGVVLTAHSLPVIGYGGEFSGWTLPLAVPLAVASCSGPGGMQFGGNLQENHCVV